MPILSTHPHKPQISTLREKKKKEKTKKTQRVGWEDTKETCNRTTHMIPKSSPGSSFEGNNNNSSHARAGRRMIMSGDGAQQVVRASRGGSHHSEGGERGGHSEARRNYRELLPPSCTHSANESAMLQLPSPAQQQPRQRETSPSLPSLFLGFRLVRHPSCHAGLWPRHHRDAPLSVRIICAVLLLESVFFT